jgi:magnesium transporter
MSRWFKKRSKKAGLSPGTLVHIGEKKIEKVRIFLIQYDGNQAVEKEVSRPEDCFPILDSPTVTWIHVIGLHETDILKKFGDLLKLNHLVLEDILNPDQRPKLEDYGDYLYIVLKALSIKNGEGEISSDQVSLILGKSFVLSFEESEPDNCKIIRDRIRNPQGRHRKYGADYLLYSLIDAVVDQYFTVLEDMGERIEALEDLLVNAPTPDALKILHHLKREILQLRKAIWPLREVIGTLSRGVCAFIQAPTEIYLRDVYDHTIQALDTVETYRDMLSGMLDIYLSSLSNRMNEVMKVLTIFATLFMPITFIVGVYGMNFEWMPELKWHWSYPLVWAVMISIVGCMLFYFRRKKWI